MAVDFKSLLNKPADSIERPKPLPPGTYNGVISGHEFGESSQKKTPFVRFAITLTSPGEDVDTDQLEGIELGKKKLRKDYFLTEDALYRLVEFVESCGIDKTGRMVSELVPETLNQPILVQVMQRPSQDGSEIYNEVGIMKGAE